MAGQVSKRNYILITFTLRKSVRSSRNYLTWNLTTRLKDILVYRDLQRGIFFECTHRGWHRIDATLRSVISPETRYNIKSWSESFEFLVPVFIGSHRWRTGGSCTEGSPSFLAADVGKFIVQVILSTAQFFFRHYGEWREIDFVVDNKCRSCQLKVMSNLTGSFSEQNDTIFTI